MRLFSSISVHFDCCQRLFFSCWQKVRRGRWGWTFVSPTADARLFLCVSRRYGMIIITIKTQLRFESFYDVLLFLFNCYWQTCAAAGWIITKDSGWELLIKFKTDTWPIIRSRSWVDPSATLDRKYQWTNGINITNILPKSHFLKCFAFYWQSF